MDVSVFSAKPYDRHYLDAANIAAGKPHRLHFLDASLSAQSVAMTTHGGAICAFVNDRLDGAVLHALAALDVRLVALRCAGFNNVDLATAQRLGITVARVPGYSPAAVAEHAVAMMLTLNRHVHRAYARVREGNFALDGLLGFDLKNSTVGIVGTGKIGTALARILNGFGCRLLAYDPLPSDECKSLGVRYVPLDALFADAKIVTLHCPLTPETRHLIDARAIGKMQRGVMLINTSRGAVVDTRAAIAGLKSGAIGYLGLDVYEEEGDLFFQNLSEHVIQDDVFARLLTFPNVLVTGHQAFFTHEALTAICQTTLDNVTSFEKTGRAMHEVTVEKLAAVG
jgi:D-lactate dehydrogenase